MFVRCGQRAYDGEYHKWLDGWERINAYAMISIIIGVGPCGTSIIYIYIYIYI
jgi:hypothetical protein